MLQKSGRGIIRGEVILCLSELRLRFSKLSMGESLADAFSATLIDLAIMNGVDVDFPRNLAKVGSRSRPSVGRLSFGS